MIWLATRLAFHNRARLAATLFGVVFSAYLTLTETALYIGMMDTATSVIRHAGADLWVASKGVQNFDFARPFPDARIKSLEGRAELSWAKPISLSWGFLKLPDGAQELVEIIGYDPAAPVGGPWEMARGAARDVGDGDKMIVDESAAQRLGELRLGSAWELNDRSLKLVGLSRSARTFTTAPVVFTSYQLAQELSPDISHQTAAAYFALKLRNPADIERVADSLRAEFKDKEVLTTRAFVERTILYWTVQTGMGAAFCLTALLGLVVGAGTIGQTVFANTMEHLREFATLKAMGATARDLNTIILAQAAIDASLGFGIAVPLALLSKAPLEKTGVTLAIDLTLVASLFAITLVTALAAAYFSIRRVQKLDPATIFRS
ncbi:ABC transporter permease [Methylocystis sp. MJC1]|jgi:putative ABC transport system permease protein|uniref:ABC transporter permease n=1 Tax=Methylocystis sp. MJC1 TaxID=2654282 RepID=UPI0013ED86ED|nr:ABC transporter permease [Methylocystis sp. MJC1]KAF2992719.1 putative ABC transporter permease [Methylocystis sp. MJC1]MBU6526682.1 FtsX-like permease family protein [Methylocystis sp. MJC1]UZX13121.1 ABC transporter permease [Methylocystis sp. MJC1]